jgi:hypothetical protein
MRETVIKMFELAEQFSVNSSKGLDWLNDLKSDYGTGRVSGEIYILSGYVTGLWAAGVISIEQLDDFDKIKAEAGY